MRLAVEEFARRGRRQAVFLEPHWKLVHYSEGERYRALGEACQAAGMNPPLRFVCATAEERPDKTIERYLGAHPEIDAVVMYLDIWAPHLYRAVQRLGKRIPEDLSAIGFNDSQVAGAMLPALTSLAVDHKAVVAAAISMLDDLIQGKESNASPAMPYLLHRREST